MPRTSRDIKGMRFGRLSVVGVSTTKVKGRSLWDCLCDCGQIKPVLASSLTSGCTKSCGCLTLEVFADRAKNSNKSNPLYTAWKGMRARCRNAKRPDFYLYGGRGITVCDEWSSFAKFAADMQAGYMPGLSIERENTNGPYCKNNCRWATPKQQANNRRSNRLLTFNGKTQNIEAWSVELGIKFGTIHQRLCYGWPVERVLSTAVRSWSPGKSAVKQQHQDSIKSHSTRPQNGRPSQEKQEPGST